MLVGTEMGWLVSQLTALVVSGLGVGVVLGAVELLVLLGEGPRPELLALGSVAVVAQVVVGLHEVLRRQDGVFGAADVGATQRLDVPGAVNRDLAGHVHGVVRAHVPLEALGAELGLGIHEGAARDGDATLADMPEADDAAVGDGVVAHRGALLRLLREGGRHVDRGVELPAVAAGAARAVEVTAAAHLLGVGLLVLDGAAGGADHLALGGGAAGGESPPRVPGRVTARR